MTKTKGLWSALIALSVLLMALWIPVTATAAEPTGSITLEYPFADTTFSLYKVGEADKDGNYTLTGRFADYPVTMTSDNAATTLDAYIAADQVEPDTTAKTDENGTLTFEGLTAGAYLLLGESAATDESGEWLYTPSPVLLSLPQWTKVGEQDKIHWNATVEAKYEKTSAKDVEGPDVVVDWDNPDHPDDVTVDKVDGGKVVEEVPDGYTVDISKTTDEKGKTTYLIKNTKVDNSVNVSTTSTIPKTGQYWWPVSAMAAAGVILVLLGQIRRKKYE